MPRTSHSTPVCCLPETQAKLVIDASQTRNTVSRLASRLSRAKRPRAATVRELADAAARLAWQSDLLSEWLQSAQRTVAFLEDAEMDRRAEQEARFSLWEAELDSFFEAEPVGSFEKQHCHPADVIEARLMNGSAR